MMVQSFTINLATKNKIKYCPKNLGCCLKNFQSLPKNSFSIINHKEFQLAQNSNG